MSVNLKTLNFSMTKKTRIGIIGCGGMANAHANRFNKVLDLVEVTALVDILPEKAEAVGTLLKNDPVIATDYREILPLVDAVLVVLPHHLHHPVSMDALAHGKHVLLEKPMALDEAECRELIAKAKEVDRVLMIAYCMRFHPLVLEMKRLLDERTYGDPYMLSIWTEQYTHYPEGHWGLAKSTLGGGQLFSHGCHYIDLMLWMLGRPIKGSHVSTRKGTPWMEGEGTSMVTMEFEGGVIGYHGATWGAVGTRLGYSFHAQCTGGMIEADISHGKLWFHGKAEAHEPGVAPKQVHDLLLDIPNAKPTDEEMMHFLDCIRTGTQPLTDPISSLEGLQVIWELYRAEEAGEMADLRGLGLGTFKG